MPDAELIASALCEFTLNTLWHSPLTVEARARNHTLNCRRGSGKATYHRYDPARRTHTIVFGRLMVKDKIDAVLAGSGHLERWLTAREIRRRGYFGGELTLERALLHTCLHEFAHLLQVIAGGRLRGSVHNRYFYQELDALHGTLDPLAPLSLSSEFPGWLAGSDVLQLAINAPKKKSVASNELLAALPAGSLVSFRFRGEVVRARVLRKNRVNYQLAGIGGHSGQRFRCHPSLLLGD